MRSQHVLIVTSGNPCRNPRPVKEADALTRAGFRVTLLTGGNPALLSMDRAVLGGTGCQHEIVPDPRGVLKRATRWFARRLVALGTDTADALGDVRPLLRRARAIAADLTIVHNEGPHWIGVQLIKHGFRVAADIEDWHSEDLIPSDRRHRPLRLLQGVERSLLNRAVYTSTTSHALADALHAAYGGKRAAVITNSFPLHPSRKTAPDAPPSFFWFSQTIGPGRGLEPFLTAWIRTQTPSRLVLLGHLQPAYRAELLSRVPADWHTRMQFLPPVPPEQLPAIIAKHDIGLALEERSIRNRDLTITNKILQYLNAGLAIVASDTAGQREVLATSPDAGVVVSLENTAALAAELNRIASATDELTRRQSAARKLAETKYCWECEAPKLVRCVEAAFAS